MSWKAVDRYSQDYIELQKAGVKFYITPKEILEAQLKAWDKIIDEQSQKNPFFAKVVESQKKFAQRAGKWNLDTNVPMDLAYDHWFGKVNPRLKA